MSTPVYVLLLAAGRGARFGADTNKCFVDLRGKSILRRSYEAFLQSDLVSGIAVVVSKGEEDKAESLLHPVIDQRFLGFVNGGKERAESVLFGLRYLSRAPENGMPLILVHDAARCLVSPALIDQCVEASLRDHVGIAPAIAVTDTIRQVAENGRIESRLNRDRLRAMQTPQCAFLDILTFAYETCERQQLTITDDLSALEAVGYPVRLIDGESRNLKITTPEDFDLAEIWLEKAE